MTTRQDARPRGLVTLYRTEETERYAVGAMIEREAIDAREILSRGGWSLTPPGEAPVLDLPPLPALPDVGVVPVVTRAEDAGPAVPFTVPTGHTGNRATTLTGGRGSARR